MWLRVQGLFTYPRIYSFLDSSPPAGMNQSFNDFRFIKCSNRISRSHTTAPAVHYAEDTQTTFLRPPGNLLSWIFQIQTWREHWHSASKVTVFFPPKDRWLWSKACSALWRNALLDSFSSAPLLSRFALTARLRAALGRPESREAAAMPTAACSAPQIFEKSPKKKKKASGG